MKDVNRKLSRPRTIFFMPSQIAEKARSAALRSVASLQLGGPGVLGVMEQWSDVFKT
jgi:hypothetical protein